MRPESEGQLAQIIRDARGPLSIVGGGTRLRPGEGAAERLETRGLTGVTLYEPEALTLSVRAGTALSVVQETLAAEKQMLAFEPMGDATSTIGGVVAANAAGPRRVQAGAARDALIGIRMVDGDGNVIRNGGRVMKNVTGYDLVKLMAGSRGRLGVLTELTFRTAPVPPVRATLALPELDAAAAVAALTSALTGAFDVSGAAWLAGRGALIRLEGLAGSVAERAEALAARLAPFGTVTRTEDDPWPLLRCPNTEDPGGDTWRILCRPSEAPTLLAGLPQPLMLDWGGGLIHLRLPAGTSPALPRFSGHARRLTGAPGLIPPRDAVTERLDRDLRARFDPRGIFQGED